MDINEKDLQRLASFPEQNPNPVIELSENGNITYHNPATLSYFPDILEKGLAHPLFANVREQLDKEDKSHLNNFSCETEVYEKIFEQKLFYIASSRLVRLYSSDITRLKQIEKKLANLALFPEQNPNPVAEIDLKSGMVTYCNPAAIKRFSDLKEKGLSHLLFIGIDTPERKDYSREIEIGGSSFEQKIYYIPNSDLIRVYSHDITSQKNIQRDLARLASFPEQNPSPIVELDLKKNITYVNPACRSAFPDLPDKKLEHPVLAPLVERLDDIVNGSITHYVCEVKINDTHYSQRARLMPESQVIRIFNNDITHQKVIEELIREKNKDITDSINYARKIQRSILPTEELVHPDVNDYFIIYNPKDIISGDFYWYAPLGDYFLFACADCTGHGVPGALMSMIGSNFITHIVNEKEITTPGGVLYELDKRVRMALKQDGEAEGRDGMDIAFCSLQVHKKMLHYAGANRPCVLIRNGEITEYEPSKFPVGGRYDTEKEFATEKIELQAGDCIYLFSDGIVDQFGGPKEKKFMKKRFFDLLLNVKELPMNEQKIAIQGGFEAWKGNMEQTDDVCIIGIRIC